MSLDQTTHVDLSKSKFFPEIGDQGVLNSCSAFSITYYQFSYEVAKKMGWNLKETNDVFSTRWTYDFINDGKNNGVDPGSVYVLLNKLGVPSNTIFKYEGDTIKSCENIPTELSIYESALNFRMGKISKKGDTFQNGETSDTTVKNFINDTKQELKKGHIVRFTTYGINNWQYVKIKDNPNSTSDNEYVSTPENVRSVCIYQNTRTGSPHSMVFVGYDDNIWADINQNDTIDKGELGAFKIANNWGKQWGKDPSNFSDEYTIGKNGRCIVTQDGFMWLSYDAIRETSLVIPKKENRYPTCQLCTGVISDLVIGKQPDTKLYLEFETNRRSSLSLTVNGANAVQFAIGDYSFSGKDQLETGSFVFDISNIPSINGLYDIVVRNTAANAIINMKSISIQKKHKNTGDYRSSSVENLIQEVPPKQDIYYSLYFPQYKYTLGPIDLINGIDNYGIYGSNRAWVNDRAIVYERNNSEYGNIMSGGNYSQFEAVKIGVDAQVGDVYSNTDVFNRGGTINGDLTCHTYNEQYGSEVVGKKNLNGPINPTAFVLNQKVDDYFSNNLKNAVNIEINRGNTVEASPSMLNVVVRAGGKLQFPKSGTYHMKSLKVEPEGIIECSDKDVKLLIKKDFNFGDRAKLNGDPSKILIASFTANSISIGNDITWNGTLVTPMSNYVNLFTNNSNVKGEFIGQYIELHQNSIMYHVPYAFNSIISNNYVENPNDYYILNAIDDTINKKFIIKYNNISSCDAKLQLRYIKGLPNKTIYYDINNEKGEFVIPYCEMTIKGSEDNYFPRYCDITLTINNNDSTYTVLNKTVLFTNKNPVECVNDTSKNIYNLRVSPNPATNESRLIFDIPENLEKPKKVDIFVINSSGNLFKQWFEQNLVSGENSCQLKDIYQYPSDSYKLILKVDGEEMGKCEFYK